ncbi:hypothetical protein PAMP_011394 [Pampus punctatissimus]
MLAAMLRQSTGGGSGGGGGGGSSGGGTKLSLGISRLSSSSLGSAGLVGGGPWVPGGASKSNSVSSDSPDIPASDPIYIMQLVSDVRKFADVLLQLKEVFNSKGRDLVQCPLVKDMSVIGGDYYFEVGPHWGHRGCLKTI